MLNYTRSLVLLIDGSEGIRVAEVLLAELQQYPWKVSRLVSPHGTSRHISVSIV